MQLFAGSSKQFIEDAVQNRIAKKLRRALDSMIVKLEQSHSRDNYRSRISDLDRGLVRGGGEAEVKRQNRKKK